MTRESDTADAERRTESNGEREVPPDADDHSGVPALPRRPLLRALGAGAALSVGSGVATAERSRARQQDDIDPQFGYATPAADDLPDGITPDHTVQLRVAPPTPREHGPLFHFEPTGLAVAPGDVVMFSFTTPDHTVTAYHPQMGFQRRVPEGVPPFSSPVVNAGGAWLYRFDEPGLYDLYCAPHHILGMNMRLVVGEIETLPEYADSFEVPEDAPLLPPFSKAFLEQELLDFSGAGENWFPEWVWLTPQEVLTTDALAPGNVQSSGTVSFEQVRSQIDRVAGGGEQG